MRNLMHLPVQSRELRRQVCRRVVVRYVVHMTIQVTIPEFTIGDRMRKAREQTGLDRITFAARAGLGRSTVTNTELGKTHPSNLVLRAWAEFTGVPVAWLTGGDEYTPSDSNREPAGLGDSYADQWELAA